MDAPGIRDKRLDAELMRQLDAFATAEESGAESAALAEALITALADVSPYRAGVLERAVGYAYSYAPYRGPKEKPGFAARLTRLFVVAPPPPQWPPSPRGRWLRMLHPDGYVREATLEAIDEPPPAPIFLAAMLLCLNDHVAQVRVAAAQCLRRLGSTIPAEMIIAALPYAIGRGFVWRTTEDRGVLLGLLARDDIRTATKSLLMTGAEGLLPRFFRDVLVSDIADGWLVELATKARHATIRTRSMFLLMEGKVDRLVEIKGVVYVDRLRGTERYYARKVGRQLHVSSLDLSALIASGARDTSATVRKAAAQGLIQHYKTLPDAMRLIEAFDNEKNAAVRDRIDFIRRQLAAG